MALRINPQLLINSFEYHEFESADTWSKPTYKEPITVNNVRIDDNIAFCYISDTTPFLEFKRKSKIITQNGSYTIDKIIKINEPFQDKLWSVELELI